MLCSSAACFPHSPCPLPFHALRARPCRPHASAALPGPAAAAAAAATLAQIVPTFPRIGGQPVRDWIGQAVDNLPGINGDDLARLLFPDLVGLVDGPTWLIGGLLTLAFVYWEGGVLLRAVRERQRQQREQRRRERQQRRREGQQPSGDSSTGSDEDEAAAAAVAAVEEALTPPPPLSPIDRARHERRRGLGWLALVTAGMIWMCGVVNGPTPFQP